MDLRKGVRDLRVRAKSRGGVISGEGKRRLMVV